jgi:hypothetical protein
MSNILSHKDTQIKMTLRLQLTPVRMVIIKKTNDNKCWHGYWLEKGPCWWEYKLVQPLWKFVWWFLKKLKLEIPYDPVMLLLSI